jgi:hypothetical protein
MIFGELCELLLIRVTAVTGPAGADGRGYVTNSCNEGVKHAKNDQFLVD